MPGARVTNTITGRDAFLRVLSNEGVVMMFGSPGTTELVSCNVHVAPGLGNAIGAIYTSMM